MIHIKPVSFDDECTCGLSSKCIGPARLNNNTISGLFIGCYPLEALLQSSLFFCFYYQSCLGQFQTDNTIFTELNSSLPTHYSINSTIESTISQLMI